MEIKWSKASVNQLDQALNFITEIGFTSYAIQLEDTILSKVESLINNHTLYPIDKYKTNNDGSYYAFEIDDYRISYRVKNSVIKIIRIRHTSRKIRKY